MNLKEYNIVKNYNYYDYCEYLQNKYGLPPKPYYTATIKTVNRKYNSRTNEGLYIHHVYEFDFPHLSQKEVAQEHDYEYQMPSHLCYCDYLEHLLLHTMITEGTGRNSDGVEEFMIPELLHIYEINPYAEDNSWRMNVSNKIINDKEVFLEIVKRYVPYIEDQQKFIDNIITGMEEFDLKDGLSNFFIDFTNLFSKNLQVNF